MKPHTDVGLNIAGPASSTSAALGEGKGSFKGRGILFK